MSHQLGHNTRNLRNKPSPKSPKKIKKPNRLSNTGNVNRRKNYLECPDCNKLYKALLPHLKNTHKQNEEEAAARNAEAKCIPMVYTKVVDNVRVKLSGEDMEQAVKEFGPMLEREEATLTKLKKMRKEIDGLKRRLRDEEDVATYEETKILLKEKEREYYKERTSKKDLYSATLCEWTEAYSAYLTKQKTNGSVRKVSMALDPLKVFETSDQMGITFADVTNPQMMRNILLNYEETKETKNEVKLKYLAEFLSFLDFLINDVESKERNVNESFELKMKRISNFEDITNEINKRMKFIRNSKKTGKEQLVAKIKDKQNILEQSEIISLTKNVDEDLQDLINNSKNGKIKSYTTTQIIQIRNKLITHGMLNLGRRSLDLTNMLVNEYKTATKKTTANKELYYLIKVRFLCRFYSFESIRFK